ncbi:Mitochondrial distribution and morphology protein 12 [Balamuthia mandrillaris]
MEPEAAVFDNDEHDEQNHVQEDNNAQAEDEESSEEQPKKQPESEQLRRNPLFGSKKLQRLLEKRPRAMELEDKGILISDIERRARERSSTVETLSWFLQEKKRHQHLEEKNGEEIRGNPLFGSRTLAQMMKESRPQEEITKDEKRKETEETWEAEIKVGEIGPIRTVSPASSKEDLLQLTSATATGEEAENMMNEVKAFFERRKRVLSGSRKTAMSIVSNGRRVLLVIPCTLPDVKAYLAVGRGMLEEGYELGILTIGAYRTLVSEMYPGLSYRFFELPHNTLVVETGHSTASSVLEEQLQLFENYLQTWKVAEEHEPHLIMCCPEALQESIAIGQKLQRPTVLLSNLPFYPTKAFPPPSVAFATTNTWLRTLLPNYWQHRAAFNSLWTKRIRDPLNRFRQRALDIPPQTSFLFDAVPVLTLCSEKVVPFPSDWPPAASSASASTSFFFSSSAQHNGENEVEEKEEARNDGEDKVEMMGFALPLERTNFEREWIKKTWRAKKEQRRRLTTGGGRTEQHKLEKAKKEKQAARVNKTKDVQKKAELELYNRVGDFLNAGDPPVFVEVPGKEFSSKHLYMILTVLQRIQKRVIYCGPCPTPLRSQLFFNASSPSSSYSAASAGSPFTSFSDSTFSIASYSPNLFYLPPHTLLAREWLLPQCHLVVHHGSTEMFSLLVRCCSIPSLFIGLRNNNDDEDNRRDEENETRDDAKEAIMTMGEKEGLFWAERAVVLGITPAASLSLCLESLSEDVLEKAMMDLENNYESYSAKADALKQSFAKEKQTFENGVRNCVRWLDRYWLNHFNSDCDIARSLSPSSSSTSHDGPNSENEEDKKQKKQRLEWMEDKDVNACRHCGQLFTFLNRRHHCRLCGGIFCRNCVSKERVFNYAQKELLCSSCNRHRL